MPTKTDKYNGVNTHQMRNNADGAYLQIIRCLL